MYIYYSREMEDTHACECMWGAGEREALDVHVCSLYVHDWMDDLISMIDMAILYPLDLKTLK